MYIQWKPQMLNAMWDQFLYVYTRIPTFQDTEHSYHLNSPFFPFLSHSPVITFFELHTDEIIPYVFFSDLLHLICFRFN